MVIPILFLCLIVRIYSLSSPCLQNKHPFKFSVYQSKDALDSTKTQLCRYSATFLAFCSISISFGAYDPPVTSAAVLPTTIVSSSSATKATVNLFRTQSKGWELARQKRTAAIKMMEKQGIVKVNTDDAGNQFLSLPWIPNQKIPYKSLSLKQRLINEVCAGALGEIAKDSLLYSVDTSKTRRQAKKKSEALVAPQPSTVSEQPKSSDITKEDVSQNNALDVVKEQLFNFKSLYAGFPIVLLTSIPQGGVFFLVKKSVIEYFSVYAKDTPSEISATLPIVLGVMAYWIFRTPAEVIKTQVQTGQMSTVRDAIEGAKVKYNNGLFGLWKHYLVMLNMDIPFQIINFVLFGWFSDLVLNMGMEANVLTRLFCGITCGMISAGITCPLDVCKTRIIARDRAAESAVVSNQIMMTPVPIATVPSDFEMVETVHEDAVLITSSSYHDTMNAEGNVAIATKPIKAVLQSEEHLSFNVTSDSSSPALLHVTSPPLASATDATIQGGNIFSEFITIYQEEGVGTLFLGIKQRLAYTGLANGIRLAAYGTSRMDLMMRSLDNS